MTRPSVRSCYAVTWHSIGRPLAVWLPRYTRTTKFGCIVLTAIVRYLPRQHFLATGPCSAVIIATLSYWVTLSILHLLQCVLRGVTVRKYDMKTGYSQLYLKNEQKERRKRERERWGCKYIYKWFFQLRLNQRRPVSIMITSDYQCDHCGIWWPK